ncbi:MAG: 1,4-dihydroxy-2-naphthoate octaprenyltransferase [Halobacteriovoraceae bacterium]|nr:1,4-dihydroxy-2-naphthoate octaprenyltransferase [Halobacteriovoraceae bacterium]
MTKIKSEIKPWILAARPKTLPAGAGPVFLGLALAFKISGYLNPLIAILTFLCALLLQISSNLINDYYDGVRGLDDENRLGPPRAVALGLLTPQQVKRGFQITLLTSFLLGLYLMYIGGPVIITIGLLSLFFSWAYTGGPFPLSHLGLGEVFAFLFFGPVAVYGTWFLQLLPIHPLSPENQLPLVLMYGASVGFISAALMGVNNLRDRFGDSQKGKKTLATFLGGQATRKLIVLFLLISQILGFVALNGISKNQFSLPLLISFIPLCLFYKSWWQLLGSIDGKDLNNTLATVGKYLFIFSLVNSSLILFLN